MNTAHFSRTALAALVAAAAWTRVLAQDPAPGSAPAAMEPSQPDKLNKIGLSYRMGLNITVDFKRLGGFLPVADPGPPTGSTFNRNYDNGSYNRVDISGNANGTTWYWGYENANQIQGNSIVMQSSSSPANGVSNNHENDPQHGFEISYSRQLYRHKNLRFGLESAFGYTLLDASDSSTVKTRVDRISDAFIVPAGVNVIPEAPYHGTFQGPGPLMSSSPQRVTTVVSSDAIVTGNRMINSDIFTLRLGPYMEMPVYKDLSFILSGGLTLLVAETDFSYHENVTIADTSQVSGPRSSSGSASDFLVGGYVAGSLSYAFTPRFSAFTGVQFQTAGQSVTDTGTVNHQSITRKESVLNLGECLMLVFGASYSF